MFFATAPSALTAGFGSAFDHPLRRRVYAQAGRSGSPFFENARAASRKPTAQDAALTQDEKQFVLTLDVPGIGQSSACEQGG